MTHSITDPAFLALPFESLAGAALARAKQLGATYADFRFDRLRGHTIVVRDRELQTSAPAESIGFSVRVIKNGSWGFAAGVDLTADAAAAVAARAVDVADTLAPLNVEPVILADEPVYTDTYVSRCDIDPFTVPEQDKINFLLALNDRQLASGKVDHVTSYVILAAEQKFFASLAGSRIMQQRVRVRGDLTAVRIDKSTGAFETMGPAVPPAGRGWEYFTTVSGFAAKAEEVPEMLDEKMASPSVKPGRYDLVIDPTNLWLTIHESIGHSTELDRVLGYEANYAGTSFATLDKLNRLQFGAPSMNVTGDRQVEYGLSTVGYDDEGVAAQTWDIIRDGKLVGYQLDRQMACKQRFGRSNGCAFADAPEHVPLQRMPNVSLKANPRDVALADLIGAVDDGIYIVGDKSWSIDMQRYNFQFTGQKFFRIKSGRIVGQVKDVAYQARTTDFWNAMDGVGGRSTYLLGGAFNCGKGQPGQIAPVSHGCPAALFRQINILNTAQEGH
ncbi:MAG TPA: TldD/PmbA family protein [Vicinamibacterales bacterium]|jgi:TldD protein|nr:TldD/PmbA family protein [Vicinamibacterales bacterium]